MILQRVIKGIGGINDQDVKHILTTGILCNWWRSIGSLPQVEIPDRLTERNLTWHQNHYDEPDPLRGNARFSLETPFISTTAGTVERDAFQQTNLLNPAWVEALRFASNLWTRDGYL